MRIFFWLFGVVENPVIVILYLHSLSVVEASLPFDPAVTPVSVDYHLIQTSGPMKHLFLISSLFLNELDVNE